MAFKKMCDEFIEADVEKVNGYLCAVESVNSSDNIGVEYTFNYLVQEETLLKSAS